MHIQRAALNATSDPRQQRSAPAATAPACFASKAQYRRASSRRRKTAAAEAPLPEEAVNVSPHAQGNQRRRRRRQAREETAPPARSQVARGSDRRDRGKGSAAEAAFSASLMSDKEKLFPSGRREKNAKPACRAAVRKQAYSATRHAQHIRIATRRLMHPKAPQAQRRKQHYCRFASTRQARTPAQGQRAEREGCRCRARRSAGRANACRLNGKQHYKDMIAEGLKSCQKI